MATSSKKIQLSYPTISVSAPIFVKEDKTSMFSSADHYEVKIGNNRLEFPTKKEADAIYNETKNFKNEKQSLEFFQSYLLRRIPQRAYIIRTPYTNTMDDYNKVTVDRLFSVESLFSLKRGTYLKLQHRNFGAKRITEFVFDSTINDRALGWIKLGDEWKYGDWLYIYDGVFCTASGAEKLEVKSIMPPPNKFELPNVNETPNLSKKTLDGLVDIWNFIHSREKKSDRLLDSSKKQEDIKPYLSKVTIAGVPSKVQALIIVDAEINRRKKSITKEQIEKTIQNIWNDYYSGKDTFAYGGSMSKSYDYGGDFESPRIYIVSTEAYNNNIDDGVWLHFSDYENADELMNDIQNWLDEWGVEEYEIIDGEYLPAPMGMDVSDLRKANFEEIYTLMDVAKEKGISIDDAYEEMYGENESFAKGGKVNGEDDAKFVSTPIKEGDVFLDRPNAKAGYYNLRIINKIDGNSVEIQVVDVINSRKNKMGQPYIVSKKYVQDIVDEIAKEKFDDEQQKAKEKNKIIKDLKLDKFKGGELNSSFIVQSELAEELIEFAKYCNNKFSAENMSVKAGYYGATQMYSSQRGQAITLSFNNIHRGGYYDGSKPYIVSIQIGGALDTNTKVVLENVSKYILNKYTFTNEFGKSGIYDYGGTNYWSVLLSSPEQNSRYYTIPYFDNLPKYAKGGSLESHGIKEGDKFLKTLSGGIQKVKDKNGKIVYINLATGERSATIPLPFENGGGVDEEVTYFVNKDGIRVRSKVEPKEKLSEAEWMAKHSESKEARGYAFGGFFGKAKETIKPAKYPKLEGKQVMLKNGKMVQVFEQYGSTLTVVELGKMSSGERPQPIDISEVDMTSFAGGGAVGLQDKKIFYYRNKLVKMNEFKDEPALNYSIQLIDMLLDDELVVPNKDAKKTTDFDKSIFRYRNKLVKMNEFKDDPSLNFAIQLIDMVLDGELVFKDNYANGGGVGLIGNQKRIDINKNGKIDAEDFEIMRSTMDGAWRKDRKYVNSTSRKDGKVIDYEVNYARKNNPSRKGYKGKTFAKGGQVYNDSKFLTKEQLEKWNDYVRTGKINGKKEDNMFAVARHIGTSVAKINAYEIEQRANSKKMASGGAFVNWNKFPDKKVLGFYNVKGKDINVDVNLNDFERLDDLSYSLYPTEKDRKYFKSIEVKSTALNSLNKGLGVKAVTNDGKSVVIKRLKDLSFAGGGDLKGVKLDFNLETDGDYEDIYETEVEKIKLLREVVDFDEVVGNIDTGKTFGNTDLKFYKNDIVVMTIYGNYDTESETLDSKVDVLGNKYNINYHPLDTMGGFDSSKFKKEIEKIDYKKKKSKTDWLSFVKDNSSYFDVEEESEESVTLTTRENGNVGDEEYGIEDIEEAKSIVKKIKEKYPKTKVSIYTVDEFVYLELENTNEPEKEYAKGGAFEKLSDKVAKNYEGKRVKPQYQKEYGKVYSKEEAKEVGDKVAGKVKANKMATGGETKKGNRGGVMVLAKKIRKDGESWQDALKRAGQQLK